MPSKPKTSKKAAKKKTPAKKPKKEESTLDLSRFIFQEEIIETGIFSLDILLGGGYTVGDMVEFTSQSGVGKSTTYLDLASRFCFRGQRCAFVDVERGVKPGHLDNYQLRQFANLKKPSLKDQFLLMPIMTFKDLDEFLWTVLYDDTQPRYDHIFLDSITALSVSKTGTENKSIEAHVIGGKARPTTLLLDKYKAMLPETKTTFWYINQARIKTSGSGKFMKVEVGGAGGFAQEHYPDVRIVAIKGPALVEERETVSGVQETVVGNIAKIWTVKNRNANPYITLDYPVRFGVGVSNALFLKDFAKSAGVITGGAGGHFQMKLPKAGEVKIRGEDNILPAVLEHLHEIRDAIEAKGLWKLLRDVEEALPEVVEAEEPAAV